METKKVPTCVINDLLKLVEDLKSGAVHNDDRPDAINEIVGPWIFWETLYHGLDGFEYTGNDYGWNWD